VPKAAPGAIRAAVTSAAAPTTTRRYSIMTADSTRIRVATTVSTSAPSPAIGMLGTSADPHKQPCGSGSGRRVGPAVRHVGARLASLWYLCACYGHGKRPATGKSSGRPAALVFGGLAASIPCVGRPVAAQREARPDVWTVAEQPALTFGRGGGRANALLGARVACLSSNRFLVADGETRELRVFGADGQLQRTLSRRGTGPGEYETGEMISVFGDTAVVAANPPGRRMAHLFTAASGYLASYQLTPTDSPETITAVGALGADALLVRRGGLMRQSNAGRPGSLSRDTVSLGVFQLQTRRVTWVGDFLGDTQISYQSPSPVFRGRPLNADYELGPRLYFRAVRDRIWIGDSGTGEIRVLDRSGKIVGRFSANIDRKPVPKNTVDRLRQAAMDSATSPHYRAWVEARFYAKHLPQFAPAFVGILPAEDGGAWIELFARDPGAREFVLMSAEGRNTAVVRVRSSLYLNQICNNSIVGIERDADGAERAVVYRLSR
jgi:hypothetical protein